MSGGSRSQAPAAALAVPGLLCLYLLATSGFEPLPALGVFNAKRILETLLFLAVGLLALFSPALRGQAGRYWAGLPGWVRWFLAASLALGLVSAFRAPHPAYGVAEVSMLALLCSAVPLVAASRRLAGERFDRLALASIAGMGAVVATVELAGFLSGWALGVEFRYEEMMIRFAHPRFYNQLQTWSLPALAALPLAFPRVRWLGALAILLLGLQWFLLLATGARGSIVSLAAGLTVVGILVPPGRARWLVAHAAGLGAGLVFYLAIVSAHGEFAPAGGEFVEQSVGRPLFQSTGRTNLWQAAWKDALEHPFLGVGPSRYVCDEPPSFAAHPHNYPLTLVSEWGFPATLMLLAAVGWAAWAVLAGLARRRNGDPGRALLAGMLAAGLIAAAVHANASGLLIMPASQVMAVLVGGWLAGLPGKGGKELPEGPGRARGTTPGLALSLSVLLVSAGLAAFSARELGKMEHRLQDYDQGRAAPRYWQYGRVCDYSWDRDSLSPVSN